MNKTKIDWCDMTWNPVTGCLHGCEYCYARKLATRFTWGYAVTAAKAYSPGTIHEIEYPFRWNEPSRTAAGKIQPYPFGFEPTFHRYRLDDPQKIKTPQRIFVCSMADLFGDWVPDSWIEQVFDACEKAPWHQYLFLTKYPQRLCSLVNTEKLPKNDNFWYGSTITGKNALRFPGRILDHTFISIEPLTERMDAGLGSFGGVEWIIIGAETGNRKGKIKPEKEWVENIVNAAKLTQAAVFMKESLKQIMGNDFIQEWPEGLEG